MFNQLTPIGACLDCKELCLGPVSDPPPHGQLLETGTSLLVGCGVYFCQGCASILVRIPKETASHTWTWGESERLRVVVAALRLKLKKTRRS
jgi:hypothetical protein